MKAGKRHYVFDVGKLLKTERECSSEYAYSARLTKKLIMKTNDKAFYTITHITFSSIHLPFSQKETGVFILSDERRQLSSFFSRHPKKT